MRAFEAAIASFQEILGYRFRNPTLLAQALGAWNPPSTPEAAAARRRLEFLGDAAWDFGVAAAAFRAWPQATAGDLTRIRALWCSSTGLADLARRIGLAPPEEASGPAPSEAALAEMPAAGNRGESERAPTRPSDRALAEIFEAALGAMVEDGGLDAVLALAHRLITQTASIATPPPVDPKSALQMLAQARFGSLPSYRLLERRGPPHRPIFRVGVRVAGAGVEIQAEAEGGNRQAAEQDAARLALERLRDTTEP
jgi:ribonuclease-3